MRIADPDLAETAAKRALRPVHGYNTTVQDSKLVVVQSCGSRSEAELVKGALEEAGIPAMVQGDTAGECVNTWPGPARDSKFWCGRMTELRRASCSAHFRRLTTKARTGTPKLTKTLFHPGASLARKLFVPEIVTKQRSPITEARCLSARLMRCTSRYSADNVLSWASRSAKARVSCSR